MGLKEWDHIYANLGLTVENVYVQTLFVLGCNGQHRLFGKNVPPKSPYTYNSPQFPFPCIIVCYEHRTHLPNTFWHLHHLLHMYGFSDVVNLLGSSPQWRAQASGGAGAKWHCEGTIVGLPGSPRLGVSRFTVLSRFFVMLVFRFCKLFEHYSQTNCPIIKTKPFKITQYIYKKSMADI